MIITIDTPYEDKSKRCLDCGYFTLALLPQERKRFSIGIMPGQCLLHSVQRDGTEQACAFYQESRCCCDTL